jgi:DNA modification methylase
MNESIEIKPDWYNYYAGYSHTFTKAIIETCELNKDSVILDPWNGAGTSTLVASMSGYHSIGVDLNPVMKVISTAKQTTILDVEIAENKIREIN